MVKAGLPILQVLGMLRDQLESPAMKDVVEEIRKSLEGGLLYPHALQNIQNFLIMFM